MKSNKAVHRPAIGLLIAGVFCFAAPHLSFCQTETLDIVTYTPPAGWAKTAKEGANVYTDVNKTTGAFCVLTVYRSTTSAGTPAKDFTTQWRDLVVKRLKDVEPVPKTETQTNADGWKGVVGSSKFTTDDGLEGYAILSVFSGFGKTAAILVLLNDKAYITAADALVAGVKLDKSKLMSNPAAVEQNNSNPAGQVDPFPDKPYTQPQKPLVGMLKNSITIADLTGKWEEGGAVVTTTVDSAENTHTDASFVGTWYTISSDGSLASHYQGRTSNQTVRGSSTGSIALSGGHIIVSITAGEGKGSIRKYQFVSYMTLPNGGAVLTMIYLGDGPDRTPNQLYYSCSHAQGYIDCIGGTDWVRGR